MFPLDMTASMSYKAVNKLVLNL